MLRFDKATFAHPDRLPQDFTMADEYLPPALAAVRPLRQQPEVAPDRIHLLGHSMGGKAAPRIAPPTRRSRAWCCSRQTHSRCPRPHPRHTIKATAAGVLRFLLARPARLRPSGHGSRAALPDADPARRPGLPSDRRRRPRPPAERPRSGTPHPAPHNTGRTAPGTGRSTGGSGPRTQRTVCRTELTEPRGVHPRTDTPPGNPPEARCHP
ncbi:alpha/beta hydrolase family protein [Streptomyces sp. NPDC020794]|uniref:alpha/beta hydrolase family protein n=1 Tax=unclassified Streptomyces TaxID=2593676 RepID=UPI0036E46145